MCLDLQPAFMSVNSRSLGESCVASSLLHQPNATVTRTLICRPARRKMLTGPCPSRRMHGEKQSMPQLPKACPDCRRVLLANAERHCGSLFWACHEVARHPVRRQLLRLCARHATPRLKQYQFPRWSRRRRPMALPSGIEPLSPP